MTPMLNNCCGVEPALLAETLACATVRSQPRAVHVAMVDEELPYPANSGKRIRTLNLTIRLAQRHRIT